jgi:hypothetical protein
MSISSNVGRPGKSTRVTATRAVPFAAGLLAVTGAAGSTTSQGGDDVREARRRMRGRTVPWCRLPFTMPHLFRHARASGVT